MHDPEAFKKLLSEFRNAYAEFGNRVFSLGAVTDDELRNDPEIMRRAGIFGYVPMHVGSNPEHYCIVCRLDRAAGGSLHEPFHEFRRLSAIGGASLPPSFHDTFRRSASPVEYWLSLMWHVLPPSPSDLEPMTPDGPARILWAEPFLESMIVIAECGLETDSPKLVQLSRDTEGVWITAQCKPNWDRVTGKLTFRGRVVKTVKNLRQATKVVAVLDAFQEQGWPTQIEAPGIDPDEILSVSRIVESLNDRLDEIRFRADGTTYGIRWENH